MIQKFATVPGCRVVLALILATILAGATTVHAQQPPAQQPPAQQPPVQQPSAQPQPDNPQSASQEASPKTFPGGSQKSKTTRTGRTVSVAERV